MVRCLEQGDSDKQRECAPADGEGRAGEEPEEALHVHQRAQLEEVQRRKEEGRGGGGE